LTADRFGVANSAYTFNGTTDDIEVADTAVISFANSQDFSISLWVKTTSANANMMPLLKYQFGVSAGFFFIMNHTASGYCGGAGIASFVAGVGSPACAASPINDGAWHHLVAEYSGQSDTITLFLDGRLRQGPANRQATFLLPRPCSLEDCRGIIPMPVQLTT